MSRLFIVILYIVVHVVPHAVFAGEGDDEKSHILALFKNYQTTLQTGNAEEALILAEQIYSLTPDAFGEISKSHATATFNVAQMYGVMNYRKKTTLLYQEHIDILDALKVPKDKTYLAKLGLLSKAYADVKNFEAAAESAQIGLKIVKNLKMPDEILADYELVLGTQYYQIYGKRGLAKRHIRRAYNLYVDVYGEHHEKTALALFWKAKISMGSKRYNWAAEKFEHVLDIYNAELSPGHDRILQTHAFLVNVYEKMGKKEKSTEHCIAVAKERPTDFDRELDALYKILPTYPHKALAAAKEGYVIAEFIVDEFGQVKDIEIIETTDDVFNKASIKALSKFRYAPTIKDGKRVETEGVLHKVSFQMIK